MSDFRFNAKTQRYQKISTGKFIGNAALRELVEESIAQFQERGRAIADKLFKLEITVDEWEKELAAEIKTHALQLFKLGKPDTTSRDYGILGAKLRKQYSYLRGFSSDVIQGNLTEAEIKARSDLYFQKNRENYERGRLESHREAEATFETWVRTAGESCDTCIYRSSIGAQPLGFFPDPGTDSECKAGCKCYKKFSFSKTRPQQNRLLTMSFGWV